MIIVLGYRLSLSCGQLFLVYLNPHLNSFLPEESCRLSARNFEQDRDAEVHKRLSEVNNTFPGKIDGHGSDSNVSFVFHELLTQSIIITLSIYSLLR